VDVRTVAFASAGSRGDGSESEGTPEDVCGDVGRYPPSDAYAVGRGGVRHEGGD